MDCLIGLGRLEEAENLLGRLERTANHLGLFAEEYDVRWQEPLGNFPQAFTHIGYINFEEFRSGKYPLGSGLEK